MAVQLVSDEVYVATGEPWRHQFDDWSQKRIRELAHACGWEGAAMEPGDYVNQEEEAARLAGALLGRWRSSSQRLGRPVRRAKMSRRAGFQDNARWASHRMKRNQVPIDAALFGRNGREKGAEP